MKEETLEETLARLTPSEAEIKMAREAFEIKKNQRKALLQAALNCEDGKIREQIIDELVKLWD